MFDIKLLMSDLKLTQSELATILGVSQTAISKVKNGYMDIPEAWVDLLNEKYNIVITKYYKGISEITEPSEIYQVDDQKQNLIKSLLNLTESNKVLADSVNEAIKLNAILIAKISVEMV